MMNKEELERFNALSQKALKDTATAEELLEYKQLLLDWNDSIEFNFHHDPEHSEPK